MYGEYGYMSMFHGAGMLLWFGLILVLIMLIMNLFKKKNDGVIDSSALDILKSRYAKGEISEEEFEQMKQVISER